MVKPIYIEGDEAEKRFNTVMQAIIKVKPEDLRARLKHDRPATSKRTEKLAKTDSKAVGKSLDRS
jgi:hypothetical protein